MNAGEIFWVEFPARGGCAQAGRRPAIIVQKEKTLPTVLREFFHCFVSPVSKINLCSTDRKLTFR